MDMYIKKKCFIVIAFLIVLLYICFFSIFSVKGKTIDLHKIISIHNNSLNLDYEKQIATIDNSIVSSYSDFNKNEYIFKNDKIIGYIQNKKVNEKSVDIKENNQYTMKDIKKLPLLSNIDFDGYVLGDVSYINSYNETVYTYYKYLNNIKTNDAISVSLNDDGTLSSFSAPRQNMFDNIVSNVSIEKVNDYVEKIIYQKYENINYKIEDIYIDYRNDKYVIVCNIALYYDNYIDSIELLYNL